MNYRWTINGTFYTDYKICALVVLQIYSFVEMRTHLIWLYTSALNKLSNVGSYVMRNLDLVNLL